MGYHEVYAEDELDELWDRVRRFSVTPCGKRVYFLAERLINSVAVVNNVELFSLIKKCIVFECDLTTNQTTELITDFDDAFDSEQVVDFYILPTGLDAVLLCHDRQTNTIVQHRLHIDRSKWRLDTTLTRQMIFRTIGVFTGGISSAKDYIVLSGRTPDDEGSAHVVRLIAADPANAQRLPDICLDRELADLESMLRSQDLSLQIFSPMINQRGIYFWAVRIGDTAITRELSVIGAIEYRRGKRPTFDAKLIQTKTAALRRSLPGERLPSIDLLNLNLDVQSAELCYVSAFIPAPQGHWRWKLQTLGKFIARILLDIGACIGALTAWWDGGYCFMAFLRFYLWIFPSVVPRWGPAPTHRLLALNMHSWTLASLSYKPYDCTLKSYGNLGLDMTSRGDLAVIEKPGGCDHLSIGYVTNPFQPPTLAHVAKRHTEFPQWSDASPRQLNSDGKWRRFFSMAYDAIMLK